MTRELLKSNTEQLISLCKRLCSEGRCPVITGHDSPDADSIISSVMMKKLLLKLGISSCIKFGTPSDSITARDMKKLGISDGITFDGFDEDDMLLLVDHHSSFYKQSVFACVDHHTTPPEPCGEVKIVLPASSCGKIIFDMAESVGLADGELERLAIYSVYLDTQSCQSPKFKISDAEWLDRGIEKYEIDKEELVRMGYVLTDSNEPIETLAMYGLKKYAFYGKNSFSTCIQIDEAEPEWSEIIPKIIKFLGEKLKEEQGVLWAFVLNMPMSARSDIYFIRNDGVCKRVMLDRLASRSRDVVPTVQMESQA